MAEATAKHLAPPKTKIFSAGVKPSTIPTHVIQAMMNWVSTCRTTQQRVGRFPMQDIDLVVSFGDAHKRCSNLPGRAKIEIGRRPRNSVRRKAVRRNYPPSAMSEIKSISGYLRFFSITGVTCLKANERGCTMNLYLMRHGIALPQDGHRCRDGERPLSHKGVKECAKRQRGSPARHSFRRFAESPLRGRTTPRIVASTSAWKTGSKRFPALL